MRPPPRLSRPKGPADFHMIMQLFALRRRLMETKMTSLRFFELLFSSRQTQFLLNTYQRRHIYTCGMNIWVFGKNTGSSVAMFWWVSDALWVLTGLIFCMQSHFQSWESINHTVPFCSLTLSFRKKKPFSMGNIRLDTAGKSPMSGLNMSV